MEGTSLVALNPEEIWENSHMSMRQVTNATLSILTCPHIKVHTLIPKTDLVTKLLGLADILTSFTIFRPPWTASPYPIPRLGLEFILKLKKVSW